VSEPRNRPDNYIVLHSDVRVGQGGLVGAGLSSLAPLECRLIDQLRTAQELRRVLAWSAFVRNITVGDAVTANGVTVELVAIELRDDGCRGILRRHAAERPDGSEASPNILLADIVLSDDLATSYEVGSGPWTGDNENEAEFLCRPRPPAGAAHLDVRITRLVPWPPPGPATSSTPPSRAPLEGPWEFRVIL
jgi:hypothetical protein